MNKITYELWELGQLGEGESPVPLCMIESSEDYSKIYLLHKNSKVATAIHVKINDTN